jgi:hypothetical protein
VRSAPASVGTYLLAASLEEVEVRKPERCDHRETQHGGDDRTGIEPGVPRPEADGDQ